MNDVSNYIRPAQPADKTGMMAVIKALGLFPPQELSDLSSMIDSFFDGELGQDHLWIFQSDGEEAVSVGYYAPERMADGTWNLYLVAVHPEFQRKGNGAALLSYVERDLVKRAARLLLIETSGMPNFEAQRIFYRACKYEQEARIRDFYKAGDDKIIFRKDLTSSTPDD